jgi:hypothetical protein
MNVPKLSDIDEVAREWIVRIAGHRGLDPDLLQLACEAAYGSPVEESDDVDVMARALKVVGPFIRQQERVKVAKEIRREGARRSPRGRVHTYAEEENLKDLAAEIERANRIARGGSDVR